MLALEYFIHHGWPVTTTPTTKNITPPRPERCTESTTFKRRTSRISSSGVTLRYGVTSALLGMVPIRPLVFLSCTWPGPISTCSRIISWCIKHIYTLRQRGSTRLIVLHKAVCLWLTTTSASITVESTQTSRKKFAFGMCTPISSAKQAYMNVHLSLRYLNRYRRDGVLNESRGHYVRTECIKYNAVATLFTEVRAVPGGVPPRSHHLS